MIGCRYALSTVVENRSNSRYSATTSAEQDTGSFGYRPFAASATARSCAGFSCACSKPPAIASAPAATAPLEHGVGADGRAVHEPTHVAPRDTQRLEARENGRALVVRRGRDLGDDDLAGGLVGCGQIGERAADVDPDDEHARGAYKSLSRQRASSMAADRSRSRQLLAAW